MRESGNVLQILISEIKFKGLLKIAQPPWVIFETGCFLLCVVF